MRKFCVAAALAVVFGLCSLQARANSILLDTFSGPASVGSNFSYTYDMFVTEDARVENDDFFVIFDFVGLVSATAAPGWSVNVENTSSVTGDLGVVNATDSAAISNVRFTRTGGTILGENGLGTFVLVSIYDDVAVGILGARDTQTIGGVDLKAVNTDFIPVPAVPLPAAAWGGMALLGMLGAARIRKARKA